MESSKRLIPYSVYLSEEVHVALKEKARSRQASKIVRDAITMILEGGDQFSSGYKQGLRDAIKDRKIADHLIDQLEQLVEHN